MRTLKPFLPLLGLLAVFGLVAVHRAKQARTPQSAISSQLDDYVYYRRCDDARAAGAAPIHEGEPGYRSQLDADGDGVACEPYYGN